MFTIKRSYRLGFQLHGLLPRTMIQECAALLADISSSHAQVLLLSYMEGVPTSPFTHTYGLVKLW